MSLRIRFHLFLLLVLLASIVAAGFATRERLRAWNYGGVESDPVARAQGVWEMSRTYARQAAERRRLAGLEATKTATWAEHTWWANEMDVAARKAVAEARELLQDVPPDRRPAWADQDPTAEPVGPPAPSER